MRERHLRCCVWNPLNPAGTVGRTAPETLLTPRVSGARRLGSVLYPTEFVLVTDSARTSDSERHRCADASAEVASATSVDAAHRRYT